MERRREVDGHQLAKGSLQISCIHSVPSVLSLLESANSINLLAAMHRLLLLALGIFILVQLGGITAHPIAEALLGMHCRILS